MNSTLLTFRSRQSFQARLALGFITLFGALVGAGCRQDSSSSQTDVVGHYALVTVDGNKVPCTVVHEGHSIPVKSGSFIINPDGTCSSQVSFSAPGGKEASREVKATYTRDGSKLVMHWQGAGTTTGNVDGQTFTMNNEGMIFGYRK